MLTRGLNWKIMSAVVMLMIAAFLSVWLSQSYVAAQDAVCDTTIEDSDCPPVGGIAASQLGQPVPDNVIVSDSGLGWVWASPCALSGCTSGIDVGHDGFNYASDAQWALFPFAAFAANGNGTPCASPWFDHSHNHCDVVNLVVTPGFEQTYGSAPEGGTPAVLNGAPGVMLSFAETFLVRGELAAPVGGATSYLTDGSGTSAGTIAILVGVAAVAFTVLVASGWYARRRLQPGEPSE